LKEEIDFSKNETIETDNDKLTYCRDLPELRERWRKIVKYQLLGRYLNLLEDQKKIESTGDKIDTEIMADAKIKIAKSLDQFFAESWLNQRAEAGSRGTVLAAYMIALYIGQAASQFLLNVDGAAPSIPFVAASILISLSALPVALTRIDAPPLTSAATLPIKALYKISPLGTGGAAITGAMLGAFYALGAVYARRMGMELSQVAVFMSTVIFGGVTLQWPLGLLSDRFDRRRVIVLAFGGTFAAGLGVAIIGTPGVALLACAALFGGLSFALYPLCVAHANDHLASEQRVPASGGLVLTYSVGAAAGPLVAALFMTAAGAQGLFLFIAACAGAALLFGIWRQTRRSPVPAEEQQSYQILARTTPALAILDPLASEEAEERP
jgi:hypothetical protein